MKKRILSILLTLCMVLCLVPITASAMEIYIDLTITGVVCFKRLIHHDMSKSLKTYKATKQKGDPHEQTENNRPV